MNFCIEDKNSNAFVPLSGLKLNLNMRDEYRVAKTKMARLYTENGTLKNTVHQSPHLDGTKVAGSNHETEPMAGMMDLIINDVGWKWTIKHKSIVVLVLYLLAIELVIKRDDNWDFASLFKEIHADHNINETSRLVVH